MRVRLLLISPETVLRETAKMEAHGFPVSLEAAASPQYAERFLAAVPDQTPDVVLLDLPPSEREEATRWVRDRFPDAHVIHLLPAEQAAAGYSLPQIANRDIWSLGDVISIAGARERAGLRQLLHQLSQAHDAAESRQTGEAGDTGMHGLDELSGRSVPFREALETATKAAADRLAPVWISGEKGTGKRLFARAIHAESGAEGPFVRYDCSAMNARDLETALGGEVPLRARAAAGPNGAAAKTGSATLLLEEISALDRGRQGAVLRFLKESVRDRQLRGTQAGRHPRVMATTARDLEALARDGSFSKELLDYFRSYHVMLPALRERPSDILLLAERFLRERTAAKTSGTPRLSIEVQQQLLSNPWPGNIRELFGVLEAALDGAGGAGTVELQHLPDWLYSPERAEVGRQTASGNPGPDAAHGAVVSARPQAGGSRLVVELPPEGISFEEIEKAILRTALDMAGGNVVRAARLLSLGRGSLRYRLEKYALVEPRRRRPAKRRAPGARAPEKEEILRRAS